MQEIIVDNELNEDYRYQFDLEDAYENDDIEEAELIMEELEEGENNE